MRTAYLKAALVCMTLALVAAAALTEGCVAQPAIGDYYVPPTIIKVRAACQYPTDTSGTYTHRTLFDEICVEPGVEFWSTLRHEREVHQEQRVFGYEWRDEY